MASPEVIIGAVSSKDKTAGYYLGLKARKTLMRMNRKKISYVFIAPFCLLFLIFTVIPVAISIYYSFTYYNILQSPVWVGWKNYIRLFVSDDVFLIAVKNTFLIAAVTGPISYVLSLLMAWFINELSPKIRALLVLLFYAPSISGNVYMIWSIMFSGDNYGYINGFLMKTGILSEPAQWLQNPKYMLSVIIVVILWLSFGSGFLSFVAGLQGIDKTYYEAGAMEGIRNRWQELWFITLPLIRPQLLFGAVISITSAFGVSDVCTALAGFPSVDYAAHTVVTHLQDYGNIRFDMGYASAIATILFIVMIASNKIVHNLLLKVGK